MSCIIIPTVMKRRMLFSVNKVFVSNDKGDKVDIFQYTSKHFLFMSYWFRGFKIFTVFRLLTDFVCLYNYEF
jgi:hypothetical protein